MRADAMAPGWLADQLPRPLSDDHLTRQLLRIFEDVGASVRQPVLSFEHNLDVGLAPMDFVRWMGRWLALVPPFSLPEERERELVSIAGVTWKLRGTRAALIRLLETITGGAVEIDDGGGVFAEGEAPPSLKKVVVDLASAGGLPEEQILAFIRLEVPANAVVELRVAGRAVAAAEDTVGEDGGGAEMPTAETPPADEPPPEGAS